MNLFIFFSFFLRYSASVFGKEASAGMLVVENLDSQQGNRIPFVLHFEDGVVDL